MKSSTEFYSLITYNIKLNKVIDNPQTHGLGFCFIFIFLQSLTEISYFI